MTVDERQQHMHQRSLLIKKLSHLNETMNIEKEEEEIRRKMELVKKKAKMEAELAARKEEEHRKRELELKKGEEVTHKLVTEMVQRSDFDSVTKVLVNFEGIMIFFIFFF